MSAPKSHLHVINSTNIKGLLTQACCRYSAGTGDKVVSKHFLYICSLLASESSDNDKLIIGYDLL